MWNSLRAIEVLRYVHVRVSLTSLCVLLAAVTAVPAQDNLNSETSISVILEDFKKSWNDEVWEPSQGRSGKYMRPLDDIGWKRRMAAFQLIVRHGKNATEDLVKALESDSATVRALSARALGYCADAEAKPALARAVEHDADPMVRLYAADSLGMLGGRDYDVLLRRIETGEKNRDTMRHIGYALDREGRSVDVEVARRLRDWNIEELASAKLGQPAPDFELESLDGRQVRLSDFRGKKSVVLVFVYGDT